MSERKVGENTGNAGKGRPPGARNKTTTALREAILLAAETTGYDGEGTGGLQGYLRRLAEREPRSFSGLLGKVLPLEVRGTLQHHAVATKEQRDAAVSAALRADS